MSRIKQKFFIACLGLALAVALFTGVFAVMGWGSLLSDVGSAVIYPFQWVGSKIGGGVSGFFSYFADIQDLRDEVFTDVALVLKGEEPLYQLNRNK